MVAKDTRFPGAQDAARAFLSAAVLRFALEPAKTATF